MPYIQIHEFESLLFSDINKIVLDDPAWNSSKNNYLNKLNNIINQYKNPELINNSPKTSPSHRLEDIFINPKYRKVSHENSIAKKIGIDNMLKSCPHFNEWYDKISKLK
ncbi:DUF4276 family protein [Campylobacter ureolyticus]|nr:DUF4276 family protein [Campylobacter ureolyticus]SUX23835.1 ATPase [Campylobacter ureolyticus]